MSILDEDENLDDDELDPGLDEELLLELELEMHRVMLLSRRFDDRRLRWQRSGRIGTFAPVKGQEAAQIGAVAALEETDWMVPSFRETAAVTWRGAPLTSFVLFDAGFNEGAAVKGSSRDLPIAIPVASQIPHAVGIGYSIKHKEGVLKRRFDPLPVDGDVESAIDGLLDTVRALGTGALEAPDEEE